MTSSKFWKGLVIGAMVGGAVTLLDKKVRKQVAEDSKRVGRKIKDVVSHPQKTVECIQNKVNQFTQAYRNISEDLQFISEKATEIKKLSQNTIETVQELKQPTKKINDDLSQMHE
jgi:methyl-accepting chemotaxis protein